MAEWDEIVEQAKILVIEDDPGSVALLKRLLKQANYEHVVTTSDPVEGIELYRSLNPDLVLLDLHLPGMDGFEVMRQMGEATHPKHYQPIVVITADATTPVRLRALVAGAKDFLTKPIDAVEVMLRIRIVLETRFKFLELERETARAWMMLGLEAPRLEWK